MQVSVKFLSVLSLLFLTGCTAVSGLAMLINDDQNPYGPWYGFIYEKESRYVETRVFHGKFDALTNCMDMLQAKTIYTKYAYYCGYDCTNIHNVNAAHTCQKVMGSPLNAIPTEKWSRK